jgi:nucleoid-associated protein YgaU
LPGKAVRGTRAGGSGQDRNTRSPAMRSIRWSIVAVLSLTLASLSACRSGADQQLADVPPPPAGYQPHAMDVGEPFPAEPLPPAQTVTFDQPQPALQAQPAPTPAGSTYTIRRGDTLWSIAARHYGDGKQWQRIVDANPGLDPQKLAVGQVITLP